MLPWIEIWVLKNDWTPKRTIMAKITRKTWRFFSCAEGFFFKNETKHLFFLRRKNAEFVQGELITLRILGMSWGVKLPPGVMNGGSGVSIGRCSTES